MQQTMNQSRLSRVQSIHEATESVAGIGKDPIGPEKAKIIERILKHLDEVIEEKQPYSAEI